MYDNSYKAYKAAQTASNPTSQFDLLEIVKEVPRADVEYKASIFGGELGPYKV